MNTASSKQPFDFDSWARLARNDPQAFEIKRKEILEATIRQALPARQQRLRGLQWQLDQIRSTSGTPLAACLRMQRLLWEKLAGESGLLHSLRCSAGSRNQGRRVATILPFRRS